MNDCVSYSKLHKRASGKHATGIPIITGGAESPVTC